MANPLRIHVSDILRRPGSEKTVDRDVTPGELGVVDERFHADDPVAVRLRLESLNDGIVVTGHIESTWHGICRRCAVAAQGRLTSEVHELYQLTVTDPEAFPLEGDQLDLEPMVREVLVLDAPVSPLCRHDCAGLCPQCGTDLNTGGCGCTTVAVDPRWDALDQLKGTLDT